MKPTVFSEIRSVAGLGAEEKTPATSYHPQPVFLLFSLLFSAQDSYKNTGVYILFQKRHPPPSPKMLIFPLSRDIFFLLLSCSFCLNSSSFACILHFSFLFSLFLAPLSSFFFLFPSFSFPFLSSIYIFRFFLFPFLHIFPPIDIC
jgi:hypothetical protein